LRGSLMLLLPLECFFRDRIVGERLQRRNPMSKD
jgi:hypothetical protein